ncbi:hypothetical protein TW65_01766 [Stemphylium lycopersici]|nr:hypothetical protein TW65_01766 [Stemphylium lycopersici]
MSAIEHLPWRYEHWNESPTKLNLQDVHTAVSVSENSDGFNFNKEAIREEDIPALYHVEKRPLLKANTDLGYSLAAIRALGSQWHIPHTYIPPKSSPRPMVQSFSPILGDASWKGYRKTKLSDVRYDQTADLREIPKRLNYVAVRLARNGMRYSVMESILNCLRDQLRNSPDGVYPVVEIELLEKVIYLRSRLEISKWAIQRDREGVQTMIQTVYAGLQQQDNQLNIRYGADMRLITIITLIFLPGTFVATFFSTSFWNFAPDNKGSKVSSWVWLYFLLTAGLTLLVFLVWKKIEILRKLVEDMMRALLQSSLEKRPTRKQKQGDEETGVKSE